MSSRNLCEYETWQLFGLNSLHKTLFYDQTWHLFDLLRFCHRFKPTNNISPLMLHAFEMIIDWKWQSATNMATITSNPPIDTQDAYYEGACLIWSSRHPIMKDDSRRWKRLAVWLYGCSFVEEMWLWGVGGCRRLRGARAIKRSSVCLARAWPSFILFFSTLPFLTFTSSLPRAKLYMKL